MALWSIIKSPLIFGADLRRAPGPPPRVLQCRAGCALGRLGTGLGPVEARPLVRARTG